MTVIKINQRFFECAKLSGNILGYKFLPASIFEPRHDKTNKVTVRPVKTQISLGIRPVWSESSLCTQWVAKDPSFLHADSKDSDQTGRMPRLIWVFAGRTLILLVLSCRGSFDLKIFTFPVQSLKWTFRFATEFITSWITNFEWQLAVLTCMCNLHQIYMYFLGQKWHCTCSSSSME